MIDREKIMYRILGALTMMNAPFVFKGALITKLVLSEGGFDLAERMTKDIDAHWIEEAPSMNSMVDALNRALGEFEGEFYTIPLLEVLA